MAIIDPENDAFGQALLDHFRGRESKDLILEANSGWVGPAMAAEWFFTPVDGWYAWEKNALDGVQGPVLDLGTGAGRASLYLAERGQDVTAVDASPGAVEVCRAQGLTDVRLLDLCETLPTDKAWQTVLLLCGNFSLAGGWDETRQLLKQLHAVTAPDACIVGDTVDPTIEPDELGRALQVRNELEGRYIGCVDLRLLYGDTKTPWWPQANFRISDVAPLVDGTGWQLADHHIAGIDHYFRLEKL